MARAKRHTDKQILEQLRDGYGFASRYTLVKHYRLNKEVKLRCDFTGIFPNEGPIIRLIGAALLEANNKWQTPAPLRADRNDGGYHEPADQCRADPDYRHSRAAHGHLRPTPISTALTDTTGLRTRSA